MKTVGAKCRVMRLVLVMGVSIFSSTSLESPVSNTMYHVDVPAFPYY